MNETTKTFPRTIEEVKKSNPLWHGLNAEEASPVSGPYNCHGRKHGADVFTFLAIAAIFLLAALVIAHSFAYLEGV